MSETMDNKEELAATEEEVAQDGVQEQNEVTALQEKVQALQDELGQARDQLLRKAAEFQNYRRRTEEEKRMLVQIGKGSVVEQLLDVVDDLSRTVEAAKDEAATADAIRQGVEMVYGKLMGELKKVGVEPIDCVGKPFDENEQEALMRQPAPEGVEPGIVLQEIQRGYRMDNRVLRHARVVVATESD